MTSGTASTRSQGMTGTPASALGQSRCQSRCQPRPAAASAHCLLQAEATLRLCGWSGACFPLLQLLCFSADIKDHNAAACWPLPHLNDDEGLQVEGGLNLGASLPPVAQAHLQAHTRSKTGSAAIGHTNTTRAGQHHRTPAEATLAAAGVHAHASAAAASSIDPSKHAVGQAGKHSAAGAPGR